MLDAQGNVYIQWVRRIPDGLGVLESAQDTAHWKNAKKKKPLPPQYPSKEAVQNYKTSMALQYCLSKDTAVWLNTIQKDELISRRSVLNTARLSARDSILMNCRRGLERGFFEGWAIQLNLQESQIHSPNPTPTKQLEACSELQWLLVKRLVTTLPGKTELLATSGD